MSALILGLMLAALCFGTPYFVLSHYLDRDGYAWRLPVYFVVIAVLLLLSFLLLVYGFNGLADTGKLPKNPLRERRELLGNVCHVLNPPSQVQLAVTGLGVLIVGGGASRQLFQLSLHHADLLEDSDEGHDADEDGQNGANYIHTVQPVAWFRDHLHRINPMVRIFLSVVLFGAAVLALWHAVGSDGCSLSLRLTVVAMLCLLGWSAILWDFLFCLQGK